MPRLATATVVPPTFSPRAIDFCRGAMTVIAAILSIGVVLLLVGGVVALRTATPGLGQEPPAFTEHAAGQPAQHP